MNLNTPRQDLRESKHSSNLMSVDFARCRTAQQPYSFSYTIKPLERRMPNDHARSQSIPICKAALRRTASELKLCEDEATADFQDYVFFSRLLTGITKQQQESVSDKFLQESDQCLAHIIGTRNGSLDNLHDSATQGTTSSCGFEPFSREEEKREDDEMIFELDEDF